MPTPAVLMAMNAAREAARHVTFARGGGGAKSAKGGKSSKKAKGATQAGSAGACCKTEGGKFAPRNNYGSLGGKASSQRAAANRVRERLAAKSKGAQLDKAAREASNRVEATRRGAAPGAMIAARSKAAAVQAARAKAKQEKAELEKKQARNAKAREKRAEKKAAAESEAALPRAVQAHKASALADIGLRHATRAKSVAEGGPPLDAAKADRAVAKAKARVQAARKEVARAEADGGKSPSTKADRAAAMKALAAKSRVASGKAGAENAARKRAAAEASKAKPPTLKQLNRDVVSPDPAVRRKAMDGILERRQQQDAAAKERRHQAEADKDVRSTGKQLQAAKDKLAAAKAEQKTRESAGVISILARQKAEASAKVAALKAQRDAARPVTPVKPPPASVEARPISDPVRLKAEVKAMDRAFDKAPGAKDNFVSLAALEKSMPHLTRQEFVAVVNKGREEGRYGLDSHEGLTGPLSEAEKAASIVEAGSRLVYISRRDD